jgi:hypothetical protein
MAQFLCLELASGVVFVVAQVFLYIEGTIFIFHLSFCLCLEYLQHVSCGFGLYESQFLTSDSSLMCPQSWLRREKLISAERWLPARGGLSQRIPRIHDDDHGDGDDCDDDDDDDDEEDRDNEVDVVTNEALDRVVLWEDVQGLQVRLRFESLCALLQPYLSV